MSRIQAVAGENVPLVGLSGPLQYHNVMGPIILRINLEPGDSLARSSFTGVANSLFLCLYFGINVSNLVERG
ncbi:unnamed protein product [Amaranthus hypochondriacus]